MAEYKNLSTGAKFFWRERKIETDFSWRIEKKNEKID